MAYHSVADECVDQIFKYANKSCVDGVESGVGGRLPEKSGDVRLQPIMWFTAWHRNARHPQWLTRLDKLCGPHHLAHCQVSSRFAAESCDSTNSSICLITAAAASTAAISALAAELQLPLTCIGEIVSGPAGRLVLCDADGRDITPARRGFDHFG